MKGKYEHWCYITLAMAAAIAYEIGSVPYTIYFCLLALISGVNWAVKSDRPSEVKS